MNRLSILAIGTELPPSVPVAEYAASLGADTSFYKSWDRVCHARDENDQPSIMGSSALSKALEQSGIDKSKIGLVLFTGVSRDYVPSWSVATEVMKLNGMSDDCVGLDITIGCLATLSALDLAQGWLLQRKDRYVAIVAAERWSHTVDKSDPSLSGMWVWADGAAAMIVGMNADPSKSCDKSMADFVGAEFTSESDFNGHVLIPYGGTRNPIAPPDANPLQRTLGSRGRGEMKRAYARGYARAYANVSRRTGVRGVRLVCNQMSPQTIEMIAESIGVPLDTVPLTGHQTGHLGASDVMLGLLHIHQTGGITEPVILGSSTAYAFGAGLVVPPVQG